MDSNPIPTETLVLEAQVVGDKFGMGMDDTHMAIRGAPVLDEPALSAEQKMIADKLTVSELMSMAVVALPPIVRVWARPCLRGLTHCRIVLLRGSSEGALEVLTMGIALSPGLFC